MYKFLRNFRITLETYCIKLYNANYWKRKCLADLSAADEKGCTPSRPVYVTEPHTQLHKATPFDYYMTVCTLVQVINGRLCRTVMCCVCKAYWFTLGRYTAFLVSVAKPPELLRKTPARDACGTA